ncbi:RBP11-like subunits of RNA polymerase [Coprinellus micaceus]|uniref:RBP11-like subunits of RNA polymerase n=1 Tax=Coprinellus micaceus TaxID=71717 RepID=A0A4Y7TJ84_COPMI|nr:RBP11-like subunits of RNA polymerase [Coprinellus micaceus]
MANTETPPKIKIFLRLSSLAVLLNHLMFPNELGQLPSLQHLNPRGGFHAGPIDGRMVWFNECSCTTPYDGDIPLPLKHGNVSLGVCSGRITGYFILPSPAFAHGHPIRPTLRLLPLRERSTQLPGAAPDLSAATFQIFDESHTIGNSLRWILMKNPMVEFCGYSNPHPSENVINLRIQMFDRLSALSALLEALKNLDDLVGAVEQKYNESLGSGEYERWEERR